MACQHIQTNASAFMDMAACLERPLGAMGSCPREYEQIKGALQERGEVFDLTHLYDPDDELNF